MLFRSGGSERERERDRERERGRGRETEGGRERDEERGRAQSLLQPQSFSIILAGFPGASLARLEFLRVSSSFPGEVRVCLCLGGGERCR